MEFLVNWINEMGGIYQVVAQGIGIIGMVVVALSFQSKSQRRLILIQLVGAALFTVNFLMLGAISGGLINFISIFRSLIFGNKKKFHGDNPIWLVIIIGLYGVAYILTFTVFGVRPTVENLLIESLTVIGMSASTIGFFLKDAAAVRKMGLIHSPAWLTYNCIRGAIGGALCEAFSLVSIVIGMLRYDIKRNDQR